MGRYARVVDAAAAAHAHAHTADDDDDDDDVLRTCLLRTLIRLDEVSPTDADYA